MNKKISGDIIEYGEIVYLYIPKAYQNDEFDKIDNEWLTVFKNEGLKNGIAV